MDNRQSGVNELPDIDFSGIYKHFGDIETNLNECWSAFRGSYRKNISISPIKLKSDIRPDKDIIWQKELGEGHAGAAIFKGKVYILDYDETERADILRCYDLKTGTEEWISGYKIPGKRNHGMSRTVPAVTEDYIVTIGPRCQVMCLERKTGKLIWGHDIQKEYETDEPLWYTGQCPLIDNNIAVIATGGKKLLIGIDCKTGNIIWEADNSLGWKMSHSSVMPYTYKGRRMYLYSANGGVAGVSAESGSEGQILWKTSAWNHSVVAPSALGFPDGKIFLTAGYGAGSMLLQLKESGSKFDVEVVTEYLPKDGLACEQQTPVVWEGHMFGVQPKEASQSRNQLVCVNSSNPRDLIWTSGKEARFGLGPYIIADDKLYILDDDATLVVIKPSLSRYEEISRVQLFEGFDAWAPIAVADGYMVLRDSKKVVCLKLRQ